MSSRLRTIEFWSWINVLMLASVWVVEFAVAERYWLATIIAYAPQHPLGLPSLLLFAWSSLIRNWKTALANLAAFGVFLFVFMGYKPGFTPVSAGKTSLRIMTYNIHMGMGGRKAIADVIRKYNPDVLCLQETPGLQSPEREPLLKALKGYDIERVDEFLTASRLPVTSASRRKLRMEGVRRSALETVVSVDGRPMRILNVHFVTSATSDSLMAHKGRVSEYLRQTAEVRSTQVRNILFWTEAHRGALAVVGDFNTPPRGRLYRRLLRELDDSFVQSGKGCGFTYSSNYPVMRIDYVMLTGGAKAVRHTVGVEGASDHRPVIVDVKLQ